MFRVSVCLLYMEVCRFLTGSPRSAYKVDGYVCNTNKYMKCRHTPLSELSMFTGEGQPGDCVNSARNIMFMLQDSVGPQRFS